MSDSIDENLLTAAKLREQIEERIDGHGNPHKHTGIVDDPKHRSNLSFLEAATDSSIYESEVGEQLLEKFRADRATEAVTSGNGSVLSHLVGVTEQDLEASALTLPARILDELDRDGALTTLLAAGDPNTGKTNTVWLLTELARTYWDDLLVVSNAHAAIVDERVTTCHDLAMTLLSNRDRPKMVVIDEGSTHFDARTNSYEVANQWSPLLKRMSKLGVEVCAVIGHTGKDVDPEMKRLTSLALYKSAPEVADFFATWPADDDYPTDRLFGGSLKALEATAVEYDPDEPAPWEWNLRAGLFDRDLDWPELLDLLRDRGPADPS
ncbi:hypothetical protein [Halorubrum sp. DTA98]|uniref:hypothetical protein n=1 Tax=Halorubrum sp. DTA98 TaxID=3402163 RepID=UPI003AB0C7BB